MLKKNVVKTILSFVLAAVFLVSACGSIEGPEIWIYASIIGVALIGYAVYSFISDKPNTEEE
ncbi:MAG: hypothetical protein IJT28_09360 [Bacteroidaceae bacterium]|nr:hypothetical protein [Bacteroidaceae bacterium]MBR6892367.1 hypothetical protein [Bacteroidaceae bacterium]